MSEEARAVLVDEDDLAFAAGAFAGGYPADYVDRLAEAFRTGIGPDYDARGVEGAHTTERMLGPWARSALVPVILPALDGVVAKLEAGGAGARPRLRRRGGDGGDRRGVPEQPRSTASTCPATPSIGPRCSLAAVPNADVRLGPGRGGHRRRRLRPRAHVRLPARHDPPGRRHRRRAPCHRARRHVAGQGDPLLADVGGEPQATRCWRCSTGSRSRRAWRRPRRSRAAPASAPSASTASCCESMARDAGFTRFTVHDVDDPANLYYEIRP